MCFVHVIAPISGHVLRVLREDEGVVSAGEANSWAVFTAAGGQAALRAIRIGLMNDRMAEVTEELVAGDIVVLRPGDRIEDGTGIALREQSGGS